MTSMLRKECVFFEEYGGQLFKNKKIIKKNKKILKSQRQKKRIQVVLPKIQKKIKTPKNHSKKD